MTNSAQSLRIKARAALELRKRASERLAELPPTLVIVSGKHKYLYPLDKAMRKQIAPLAQPYPKKDMRPVNGDNIAASDAGRFDSEPGALG